MSAVIGMIRERMERLIARRRYSIIINRDALDNWIGWSSVEARERVAQVLCYNRVKFSLRPDWSETTLYVNVTIGTSITTLTVDLADPQSLPVMRSLIDVHITRLGVYIGRKQRREQLKPKWDAFQTTRSK